MTALVRVSRDKSWSLAAAGVALTVTQAARACRINPTAIQRWIEAGSFPHAARDPGAGWTVPVADLEAAGLRPRVHLYKRVAAIRIVFGVIFAIDAFLKWRPCKGGATDIGTGIIYVIVFLALYQLDTLADESPWSFDPIIERRFPRWRIMSEPSLRVKGGGSGAPAEMPQR